ncbi:alkaline phosphatase family protein [Catenulispora subtropica]|uniref:Alkaline phosphatase family protein n=1 Tax=Catenulispora subtropica TaxID=450798 RepID=A0ABN2SIJ9_9ACTN
MSSTSVTSSAAGRVLVIGIDGTRLDVLRASATPALDTIAEAGFLAPVLIDDATPTWSGPCWATIATGVPATRHGIYGNDFTGHRLADHPDFLTVAAAAGLRSYLSVGSWAPLATTADGGPLFAAPSRLTYSTFGHDCERGDAAAVADAVRVLADEDVHVAFVYLGDPDETAHELGVDADYVAAVERADTRVDLLLAALRSRPMYEAERWTVIAVTDHGHVDEGGHGGDSDVERTAWIAAAGPGIAAGAEVGGLRHVDVAAQVYSVLGLEAQAAALGVEGRVFGAVAAV